MKTMDSHQYRMTVSTADLTDPLIMEQIEPGSRVIDLGCGDGRLLQRLRDEQGCSVQGIELDKQRFMGAIRRGVGVLCSDLDEGLQDIPTGSFDYAVLSQTLQQVRHPRELVEEMLRVSRRALVVVPNFGHWKVRLQVVRTGRVPVTAELPYEWYDTPNLHFLTMHDFRDLARRLDIHILKERPIIGGRAVDQAWAANLRADSVLYVLEGTNGRS